MQRKYKYITLGMLAVISLVCTISAVKVLKESKNNISEDYKYVLVPSLSTDQPVTSSALVLVKPFSNTNVEVAVDYYDITRENNEKSIIVTDNLYMQNTGILYTSNNEYDVLCILDGYVTEVGSNGVIGNYVKITHSNNIVSTYQVLSDVVVKKGDYIKQGDKIAKSSTNKIINGNNLLLFELEINGTTVNPTEYYNKSIKEI